ncbi:hypothetical protein EVAR_85247_1 [Eumeta japonica]|uniref:Uncharacterized protein n=1 Tax=Eumeta variegata TaxID=151549 RepID=A0A4C1VZ65_EUMVA|nr:hypothetical protein EVAR_85247_1 [Eumeta japonica]
MTKMNGDATQRDHHQKISIDNLANGGIDKKVKKQTTLCDDEAKDPKISIDFINDNRGHSKSSIYTKNSVNDITNDNIQLDINENDYTKQPEGEQHENAKNSIVLNGVTSKRNETNVTAHSAITNTALQKALTLQSTLDKVAAEGEPEAGISNFIVSAESTAGDLKLSEFVGIGSSCGKYVRGPFLRVSARASGFRVPSVPVESVSIKRKQRTVALKGHANVIATSDRRTSTAGVVCRRRLYCARSVRASGRRAAKNRALSPLDTFTKESVTYDQ